MIKLFRASLFRYFHSVLFWICFALSVVFAVIFAVYTFDDNAFFAATAVMAVMISVSVGGELGGQCKNKIIYGYGRTVIFFSELLCSFCVVSAGFAVYSAIFFVCNAAIITNMPAEVILKTALGFYLISLSLCALFVFICSASAKKTVSAILCLLTLFAMYIASGRIMTALSVSEYVTIYTVPQGENIPAPPSGEGVAPGAPLDGYEAHREKNPNYIDGTARSLLILCRDINPFSQLARYSSIAAPYLLTDGQLAEYMADPLTPDGIKSRFDRTVTEEKRKFLNTAPLYGLSVVLLYV